MTREELTKIYKNAAYIFKMSRLTDVRRKAQEIAVAVEEHIGQLDSQPASTWEP